MQEICIHRPKSSFVEEVMQIDGKPVRCLTGYVDISTIPKFSNDNNVRKVDRKSKVISKIGATLRYRPEQMPILNMGITVMASKWRELKKEGLVLLCGEKDGVINGGHTRYAIEQAIENSEEPINARVKLTILESQNLTKSDIAEISVALNDSAEPAMYTLIHHKGLVETLKNSLKPEYAEKIVWVQNGEQTEEMQGSTYMILDEFLELLNCFDVKTYGCSNIKASTKPSKGKAFQKYILDETRNFDYLSPIVNDIVELSEKVDVSLTKMVNPEKGKAKIKGIRVLCSSQDNRNTAGFKTGDTSNMQYTVFNNLPYVYTVYKGFQYVILNAFRANMTMDDAGVHWIVPVKELFDRVEKDIWETILSCCTPHIQNDSINVSYVTRTSQPIWDALYTKVQCAVLEMQQNKK